MELSTFFGVVLPYAISIVLFCCCVLIGLVAVLELNDEYNVEHGLV